MSRKDDLERLIRNSYDIIHQYEEIARTSDRPEEVQRSQREIEEQRGLIWNYLVEYLALCQRRGWTAPEDIDEIAATFGPELAEAAAAYRPPLVRLPPGRGWIYGAAGLAVLVLAVVAVLVARGPAEAPQPTPTFTSVPPTKTVTPSPSPSPPSPTPSPTPIFGQGVLYRVAISEFDARRATRQVEIARRLEDDLRTNLRTYGLAEDVDVKVVPEVIASEDQAHSFAAAAESDVLIWGWYDDLGIRLHVVLGEEARTAGPALVGLHELPLGAANETRELSFYVQDVLPANTTFLSMFVIGHLYYLSNNYAAGHQAFDAAMANIPETVALENEALLHFFNARLMQTATFTDPTEIVCEYARAIELDPDLLEAYNNLAVLIMDVCEDRRDWGYLSETCVSSLEVGCVSEAGIPSLHPYDLLSQTLQIRPDWALAWHNLAALDWNNLTGQGSAAPQHAEESFRSVLELDPTIVGAHIMLGNLKVLFGNFALAAEYFSTAAELWPESAEVRVNLGQALALAGRDEEAMAAYQQALALSPEGSDAYLETHLALGNLFHRRGDLSRAYEKYGLVEPHSAEQDSGIGCTLSLLLTKYEIDAGAWASAAQRIETSPIRCNSFLSEYILWLIHSIVDDPEADDYVFDGGVGSGFLEWWTLGDVGRMTWSDIYEDCYVPDSDITTWGSESNPCLPNALEDRLEAVYARIQRYVHHRLFFNQHAVTPIGACPYVFTFDDEYYDWLPDTTILYRLIGPEAERVQARPLARFDGRLWLRELEPETSYVDQLYVRVLTADGHWLALAPDDLTLAADDGDYLVLHPGDERLLTFELPPGALPVQRAWVVAAGYYVAYGEEE